MRVAVSTSIAALLAAVVALTVSAPALAATVAVPNACWWTVPGEWNNETLTFTGNASVERTVAGTPITLSGVGARIVLPREVIDLGFSLGLLKPGDNDIPIRAWAALRGTNTAEGLQVRESAATARTTIVADSNGEIVSATPIDVQTAFADTNWTAAGTAAVSFTQAEAGTLPPLPVGRNGANLTPKGSVYITAKVGLTELQLDCQPGTRTADASGPLPAPGPPFAFTLGPDGTGPPPPAAVKPKPKLTVRSTKLKVSRGGTIALKLRCAGAPCTGRLQFKSARKPSVTVVRPTRYTLAAGADKTLKLKLTAAARKLLSKRKLTVRLTTQPSNGTSLTQTYTLQR